LLLANILLAAGCQPAVRYEPRPEKGARPGDNPGQPTPPKPLAEAINWLNLGRHPEKGQHPIVFVHEATSPKEWAALPAFWNDPGASLPGKGPQPVRVKVPLGLLDPSAFLPTDFVLTRERWELGRRLFYDADLLGSKQSCATCHDPANNFTDGKQHGGGGRNTPTLVNVVFNRTQMWDGRLTYLEEVMQATLEDERAPEVPFRHAWPGVIGRLRKSPEYVKEFQRVFGVPPTQDTAGLALAAFLRTILVAGSVHDQADARRRSAGDRDLTAAHYEAVLDPPSLAHLGTGKRPKSDVAAELARGYRLFHGQAGCARCHNEASGTFSDGRYHNVDVGAAGLDLHPERRGRFNVAPLGEKTRWLMGAWKTPTLRGLRRTAPYFHDGSEPKLFEAVNHFVRKRDFAEAPENIFLSRMLASEDGNFRDLKLTRADVEALTLFLHALDGPEPDVALRGPGR
jgi:cytochrome c peroxidase